MRYRVTGTDRETGEPLELTVDAIDESAAVEAARRRGIVASHVESGTASAPLAEAETWPPVWGQAPPPPTVWDEPAALPQTIIVQQAPPRTSSLGVASLIVGVVAFVFCWMPYIGVITLPLSALGVLLAGLGFLVSLARGGAGIGYSLAGGAMSALALVIAVRMWMALDAALRARESAALGLG